MASSKNINPLNRRLKKSEIKQFLSSGGAKLHEEYTKEYYEKWASGHENQDYVYELPNGDFILVFDPNGLVIPGKGNYYTKDSFLREIRWRRKVDEDYKYGRASSVDHWRYYSKQGNRLFENIETNIQAITEELNIEKGALDFSYKSLGKIDLAIENYPYGKTWETLYDALIFYVGEIIKNRIEGIWSINKTHDGGDYPFVTVKNTTIQYMPINIVWQETDGSKPCNLRKATADEIRTNAIWHPKNNKWPR